MWNLEAPNVARRNRVRWLPPVNTVLRGAIATWTLALSLPSASAATSKEVDLADAAALIADHRMAMSPQTSFERWQADLWSIYARTCARAGRSPMLGELYKIPSFGTNLWTSPAPNLWTTPAPEELVSACSAMATYGPQPSCQLSVAIDAPFSRPPDGFPDLHVYMRYRFTDGAATKIRADCDLVKGVPSTRQYFEGVAKVRWQVAPASKLLTTETGDKVSVEMGSVEFYDHGLPSEGKYIRSAVIPPLSSYR